MSVCVCHIAIRFVRVDNLKAVNLNMYKVNIYGNSRGSILIVQTTERTFNIKIMNFVRLFCILTRDNETYDTTWKMYLIEVAG